jgi:hypothetical protein
MRYFPVDCVAGRSARPAQSCWRTRNQGQRKLCGGSTPYRSGRLGRFQCSEWSTERIS